MSVSLDRADRPPLIVIENVVSLLYGADFPVLCETLAAFDMQFGPLFIDARRFLQHSRPRIFVAAVDVRVDCSEFTDPNLQLAARGLLAFGSAVVLLGAIVQKLPLLFSTGSRGAAEIPSVLPPNRCSPRACRSTNGAFVMNARLE